MENNTKKKTKAKKSSTKEIEVLSELEKKALEKWREKDNERIRPPKFLETGEKTVAPKEEDPDKFWPQMMETTGSTDIDFFKTIVSQVTATLQNKKSEEVANFVSALMHGLKPRDETEGILIAQMAGTHNLIMEYMNRAMIPGQFLEASNDCINRAYKLMNIFLKQIDALERYRGKRAEQKVIVEHVHIHEGGKAIVGHVENRPRGEGDEQEK